MQRGDISVIERSNVAQWSITMETQLTNIISLLDRDLDLDGLLNIK